MQTDTANVDWFPTPPEASGAEVSKHEDGMTVQLSSLGMTHGVNKLLVLFGILGCSVPLIVILLAVLEKTLGVSIMSGGEGENPYVAAIIFTLIGLGLFGIAAWRGTYRAIVDVVGDHLVITSTNCFRQTKQHEWDSAELSSIRMVEIRSGGHKGGGSMLTSHLEMKPAVGERVLLLEPRPTEELKWLAEFLRHVLKIED